MTVPAAPRKVREGMRLDYISQFTAPGSSPGGGFIGALFFVLLFFAALTSSISLLESIVSHLEEVWRFSRMKITIGISLLLWVVGLGSVFSFNVWADFTPLSMIKPLQGKTIFGLIDYFGSNLLMPIGGILMALIAGWLISKEVSKDELWIKDQRIFLLWRFLIRYVAPTAVLAIFISNLMG